MAHEKNELDASIKALIHTKIVDALSASEEYIDALVRSVLEAEVDSAGRKPDASTTTRMPWLESLTRQKIREYARRALEKALEEAFVAKQAELKAAIKARLSSDDAAEQIASCLVQVCRSRLSDK